MARTKRWIWRETVKGVCEIQLSSWKYFSDFVYQEMASYNSYVWRGQRCDNWKLESTLDRLVRTAKVPTTRLGRYREQHLEQFKLAARGRRGPNPPILNSEDAWWALGQHHGLSTPLLDWTTSPFVAAFFAFMQVDIKQTKNRAIYALHRPSIEKMANLKAKLENISRREQLAEAEKTGSKIGLLKRAMLQGTAEPEVTFFSPLSDENHRLVSQGGLFSKTPSGQTLEDWVSVNHDPDDVGTLVIKILVPDSDRDSCLRILNRMNINHLSLFPDLSGASMFCNLFSEVEKY